MSMKDAASAIIALINSKPVSPTREEIEALLARNSVASALSSDSPLATKKKSSDYRMQWDALRREREALENDHSRTGLQYDHPRVLAHEAALAENDALMWDLTETIWATRADGPADLLLLAEVAYDQFFDIRSFPSVPADCFEDGDRQEIVVALVVRGIVEAARTGREWATAAE